MYVVKVILQISCLYGFYKLGEMLQSLLSLPIPGSIIGMLLLFGLLSTKLVKSEWFFIGSSLLLAHLPLLFIPATVGVIDYLNLFNGSGLITLLIVILSTILVMISSAGVSQFFSKRQQHSVQNCEPNRELEL
ncbi:CidA/LrgA family protein [Metabacillus herbersteinensis]|uniref:CidA/LrgA family protein n=1 Tax=Metabacillus herbersteinensis TaxID=283816 RepID=A0ABV6GAX6_9BACI